MSFGIEWLLVPILLIALFVTSSVVTVRTYRRVRAEADSYSALASEVEALRNSNGRLRLLEAELSELRELQIQMLRLAGIETALGVDLALLEELRNSQLADTLSTDPSLFLWPVEGEIISGFNLRHPGVDIAVPRGQTAVAAGFGVVDETGTDSRYGRKVVIRHNPELETVYANLSLNLVEVGDTVRVGQVIGLVGVGREGIEPHLHFEVRLDGEPAPPETVIQQEMKQP